MRKIFIGVIAVSIITISTSILANAEWKKSNNKWLYKDTNGYSIGWKYVDNDWYYFDGNGQMETGWVKDNNKWYYLSNSGAMNKSGWIEDGGKWYYLTKDGSMASDTIADNYFVDSSGAWIENNAWKDKKYNALGDSITKGIDPSNSYQVMKGNRYSDIMQRCLKLSTTNNYGIEGTTIVHQWDNNGMIDRYKSMSNDADLISVFGGTNDFAANAPMGTINSGNNNEFKCAFNNLIKGLIAKYPSKKIFVITPMPRHSDTVDGNVANANGFTLKDYVNAEIEICKMNGIQVLNLYDGALGITPYNKSEKNAFITDGTHPNINGMYIVTKEIIKFINKF